MKSCLINLLVVGLLGLGSRAQQFTVQQKLSQIATELNHYALMTDVNTNELTDL
jgi:hypothetical protein